MAKEKNNKIKIFKFDQTWSNLIKLDLIKFDQNYDFDQFWSNLIKFD